jgi:hypothetical protein
MISLARRRADKMQKPSHPTEDFVSFGVFGGEGRRWIL